MYSDKNNENNPSRQVSQTLLHSTSDNVITNDLQVAMSSSLFEGLSSVTSSNSRYLDINHENKKWKDLIVFMNTEPSLMIYSNVLLIVCSIILMITSDIYISNLNITRTFLNLESNKPIFFGLYSGFIMALFSIFGLYGALTIRRKLCYYMSSVMIVNALFQFGLGLTIINRNLDQEIMVRKEMKFSFLSYGIKSDLTKRWNEFQSELSCCGLYGGNSYKAREIPLPKSCCKVPCTLVQPADWENNLYNGCLYIVKKLEEKFLKPVIILIFFCSFLQMSNAIFILNLLRPKPKPRRYHIAYKRS